MADKIVITVAEADKNLCSEICEVMKSTFDGCVVYSANEGSEALKKLRNVPPKLFICGMDLGQKVTFEDLVRNIEAERALTGLPMIVLSDIADTDPKFTSDLASGRIKFLSMPMQKEELISTAKAILNTANLKNNQFDTVKLKKGEVLFLEGEKADAAFLVKVGKLAASRKSGAGTVELGVVLAGEFVGEMAHITGEPRNADVKAVEDTELVKIPCGTLDLLIFSKPTWTKALLKTLCRRLREANLKRS